MPFRTFLIGAFMLGFGIFLTYLCFAYPESIQSLVGNIVALIILYGGGLYFVRVAIKNSFLMKYFKRRPKDSPWVHNETE